MRCRQSPGDSLSRNLFLIALSLNWLLNMEKWDHQALLECGFPNRTPFSLLSATGALVDRPLLVSACV